MHSSTNSSTSYDVTVYNLDSAEVKTTATGVSGAPFIFNVGSPELWTPDSPRLYNITIRFGNDLIQTYTGFRTVSRGIVNNVQRPLLNGEFILPFGTLDQGKFNWKTAFLAHLLMSFGRLLARWHLHPSECRSYDL